MLCLRCVVKRYPTQIGSFLNIIWSNEDDSFDEVQSINDLVKFLQKAISEILIHMVDTETSKLAKDRVWKKWRFPNGGRNGEK